MQHKIAVWLAGLLETKQDESEENTLLLVYGIEVFLNEFFKIATAWGIGLLAGRLKEAVFATFFLLIMRNVAGGKHFKNNFICFITSVMAIVLPSVLGSLFILPIKSFFILSGVECITLFLFSPCFPGHALDGAEKWGRKSAIAGIYILVMLLFFYKQNWTYGNMVLLIAAIEIISLLGKKIPS